MISFTPPQPIQVASTNTEDGRLSLFPYHHQSVLFKVIGLRFVS
ncbi:hypothetical protein AAULR_20642 [Lacticaseibacillus rhamnosus MTCC 5462]|nr:hypothetical protein AAULR_20642 [Lacticaseibacillus rhamnosus MTCC 5462]